MKDACGSSRNADRPSQNDDPAPEENQHYYTKVRTFLKTFLPYLDRVINCSQLLETVPNLAEKLQYLHDLVDTKSFSPEQVENCKKVFCELYNTYSHRLNHCLSPDFTTSGLQETKSNDEENNISSDGICTSNKSNQNQNSESKNKSYFSKNAINDSMLTKNDLPAFSDSRLRLNKIIGYATNASIEKRLESDASILHPELPTQIVDEMPKNSKNGPVIPKDLLKSINMIDIDMNLVKEVLDAVKRTSCVEPLQPPPLSLLDFMNLGASRINSISTTEPNSSEGIHDNILSSKSSSIICASLNTQRNKLHNTGSPKESKQQFISALKPGTLIDLENSKVICGPLHIETLRPVIKSNKKNADIKTSFVDKSIPRDSRLRSKSLLSSENNVSPFNTLLSLISNGQNTIPTSFAPNTNNSNPKSLVTRAQEMSVHSGQSSSSHTNIQLVNKQVSSEHCYNSIKFKNRQLSLNKYDLNFDKKNDDGQFRNSAQMHGNLSHTKPLTKYCDPVPYKIRCNDTSKRDSRTLKSVKTTPYPNYKEYREAKYREQNKGFAINKNQINQDQDKYLSLVNKKMEKNYKIRKLKTFENNINSTAVLKTDQKYKSHLKANTIKEQHLVNGQKKNVLKISNKFIKDLKITDKINDTQTDKDLAIEITKNSKTDRDLKIKTKINENENDRCPEINLEETTVNIPNKVIKDQPASKSEQNCILIDYTDQNKSKKRKNCSKEKEFEKMIKDVDCSNNDTWGPSRRTRSSVRQKKILENLNLNNSKPKFEIDIVTKNDKKSESNECIMNYGSVSIPVSEDVRRRNEIRHNIISSPSKEQSGVVNSTTAEIACVSQQENTVSTSGINSTANYHLKNDDIVLTDVLKNQKCMNVMSILQDEDKMKKLNKLLESSDVKTNDDKLKQKGTLNKDKLEIDKRKMEKEKRKRKKIKKKVRAESLKNSNEESKNKFFNCISNDNNSNQAENRVETKMKKPHLNELNIGSTSFGNIYGHLSTGQQKLKSNESYGHFEILKDRSIFEEKQLKIVIAKLDRNIKGSKNCNADTSTNDYIQTNNKPINVKIAQKIKSKKSFVDPLSVKLARQKLEMELSDSQNERDIKNQHEFETRKVGKRSKSVNKFIKKENLNSETLTSLMIEQPIALIRPFQNIMSLDNITDSNKPVEQNSNTSTYIVDKPKLKKTRLSEVDKLRANICGMFDCEPVLNSSKIRQCRTNKKIDYVNKKVVSSKKKETSYIKESDSNEDINKFIYKVGKPKNIKEKVQKLTIILNKKEQYVKKSMANETGNVGGGPVVQPIVLNKVPNKKFKKEGNKKMKKSNDQFKVVLCDGIEMNNVENMENEISTKIESQVVTEDIFNDKLYFQTNVNSLDCKFCNYKDKGLKMFHHCKHQHCGEEVLPSRLPENCAKLLILQSLKENFQENSQVSKPICHQPVSVNYTCVFCQFISHDYFKFYDHITGHTGEYRYKCKMCEQMYSNEDDLENHILEHTDYDKTDGISSLIFPNIMLSKYVFGYLCSFCYYVQLNYNNIVKHMASQHFDEDKKLNSHWTVIRINMSMADKIYTNSSTNFDNLVGCLPPIQPDQVISKSKDNDDQNQQLTVTDLKVRSNEQKQPDSFFSIEKKCNEQTIDEIAQKSITDESIPESSFIHVNPPVSVNDRILPELNMLQFLQEQASQSPKKETRISTERSEIQYSEYTLKEKSKKCALAGLSCELINSMLLFKCSVSSCLEKFSTAVLIDFSKHLINNHQFVIWDGNCKACHYKLPIISDQYYVKNALEHLVSHHLVLKNSEQHPNAKANREGLNIEGLSSFSQDTAKTPVVKNFLRIRCLPGDKLSTPKREVLNIEGLSSFSQDTAKTPVVNNFLRIRCLPGDKLSTPNREVLNIEGLSSFSQDTAKTPVVNNFLRIRCLPGDKLSTHKPKSSSISNIHNMSVRKSLSDDTNSINKSVNLNINHGSNNKKLPLSSLQISDVKSLEKRKASTSKLNSNASDNDDLNMWMKSTHSEVVVSNSEAFLEAGQQIVNNGVPIDGTIVLIDTSYLKNYNRKVKIHPMNVMKTQLAFTKMSALPRLLGLFKCMDRSCSKIFSSKELFKLHMAIHFSNAKQKKGIQRSHAQQFKMCVYCFKEFDDEESLADHIAEKYTFCEYFCPHCFYRAYTPSHVLVHQSVVHTNTPKHCILKLQYDDGPNDYPKEMLLVVDFKEFVLPYKCSIGCCGFSCYLHNEFLEHLNQEHQQCDKFCCYICEDKFNDDGFFTLHPSLLITHFKLHNLNKYQCIFCLFGSENIDSMIKHLAFEHFEYEPLCLERSTVSDDCESKNIKNLKILRLKKIIDNGVLKIVHLPADTFSEPEVGSKLSKKISIECPDVLSIAMKSARIDEGSQPPDAIVSTVPNCVQMAGISTSAESLAHNNEIIKIDDDVNQNDLPLKKTSVWSEFLNEEKKSEVLSNDDISVINNEDDVDLSEKEKPHEGPTKQMCLKIEESINGSNEVKRLVFPMIELDKLFVCRTCEIVFSNGEMYCAHLRVCPFWDFVAGQKCMYCVKVYKRPSNFTEHIKLHGPNRFNCYLCNLKVPSQQAIKRHMRSHKIINFNFVPDRPNLTDLNKDDFTIFEDKTVNIKKEEESICIQCPFKGSLRKIISHMKVYHRGEDSLFKVKQEQPNYSNNSVNSLMPQQNTRLKRKRFTVD